MEKQNVARPAKLAISTISCPLLIHGEGYVDWTNQAFVEQFGIRPASVMRLKVRELLWCLGLQDPLAGMIAEGVLFEQWEVASINHTLSPLFLSHIRLQAEDDSLEKFMLIISDMPDWHEGMKEETSRLC